MAITAGNAVFQGNGPAESGQITSIPGTASPFGQSLVGTCTVTGDAASSTFNCNYIDGTKTIGFTPSAVLCNRSGGAATSSISVVSCVPTDNKLFAVVTSANVNAATFILSFLALK